jgi:6-phosphogluconolactonase
MVNGMTTFAVMTITALASTAAASGDAIDLRDGAVYLMTNQAENAVIVFDRRSDGSLRRIGQFATGGAGDPVPQGADPPTDPLASQGALLLTDDGRFLIAANAGSNDVSVFRIGRASLSLVQKRSSGGKRPISIASRGSLVYVLNEGGTPNVTGFTLGAAGALSALPGSARALPSGTMADPAQVSFSHDGELLAVTEKATNLIVTYPVRPDGLTRSRVITPSNGLTPFGFAFDSLGRLIVSEAAGGLPGESSASSYDATTDGVLTPISSAVRNFQTAACWVVVTADARHAFVSNTGSGEVSSFRLRADGRLARLDVTASDTNPLSLPIDMALSGDSRYLYVHLAGRQAIAAFRVGTDGSLSRFANYSNLPFAAQGIAAN